MQPGGRPLKGATPAAWHSQIRGVRLGMRRWSVADNSLMSETLHLLEALIARASVTPQDGGCQSLIAERLAPLGFRCESMPFGPEGARVSNLWAAHRGQRPGPT